MQRSMITTLEFYGMGLKSNMVIRLIIFLFMGIAELQTAVDAWIKTHGVRYFNELTNMTILVEEVGELARVCISKRYYGKE